MDTVGYGDQINKEDSFKAIVKNIDDQFENYLQEELKIKRSLSTFHDTRIHACLYFICPTGTVIQHSQNLSLNKLNYRSRVKIN